MNLSTSFTVDPHQPWVQAHNREVREVLAAFEADRPIRVPLVLGEWSGQHGFYADEIDLDYRDYYRNPQRMIEVQLEAARRRREMPICDVVLGEAPQQWPISVDLWPVVAPGWVGCRLVYRSDAVIAHESLRLSKKQAGAMEMPDPLHGGIVETCGEYWREMGSRCDGLTFLRQPVGPVHHGVGTNGVFSLGLDIRGEDLMADMYDDPDFVHLFLRKVASWCQKLQTTWSCLAGDGRPSPLGPTDHGIDMLSPDTYEQFMAPAIEDANRRIGAATPTFFHHCGRGSHLFPIIKKHFHVETINALTWPFIDIAKVRRDLGEQIWIQAILADSIVQQGPPQKIREAIQEVMKAKGRGRLCLMVGDMLRGTPMEHRLALYEAVKEFGQY